MKKSTGLSFSVWINWTFFGLFFVLSVLTFWAILGQKNVVMAMRIQELAVLLFAAILPAIVFLINAVLFKQISKDKTTSKQ